MPVTGDFEKLNKFREQLEEISEPAFHYGLNRVLAEEARTQIVLGFEAGRDPYGKPWTPVTSRSGQPLRDKGFLLNSLAPHADADGFTVRTNLKYAAVHQYGATIKAKTPKGLIFRIGGRRGGKSRGKNGRYTKGKSSGGAWVRKMQVTIPQRQYMPEGDIGPIWSRAFERVTDSELKKRMATI